MDATSESTDQHPCISQKMGTHPLESVDLRFEGLISHLYDPPFIAKAIDVIAERGTSTQSKLIER